MSLNPKHQWLAVHASGHTLAVGTEDAAFWQGRPDTVICGPETMGDKDHFDTVVLGEVLQLVDDPQALLRQAIKLIIVVPNEHSWDAQFQPFKNAKHKRGYDTEALAQELDKAGRKYRIEDVSYQGWSFLCASC